MSDPIPLAETNAVRPEPDNLIILDGHRIVQCLPADRRCVVFHCGRYHTWPSWEEMVVDLSQPEIGRALEAVEQERRIADAARDQRAAALAAREITAQAAAARDPTLAWHCAVQLAVAGALALIALGAALS